MFIIFDNNSSGGELKGFKEFRNDEIGLGLVGFAIGSDCDGRAGRHTGLKGLMQSSDKDNVNGGFVQQTGEVKMDLPANCQNLSRRAPDVFVLKFLQFVQGNVRLRC